MGKAWSDEEIQTLCDLWGERSVPYIAKTLNRSINAINIQVFKLGLGSFLENGKYITFNQLLLALGYDNGYSYKKISWVKNRNFPIKYRRVNQSRYKVVYLQDFWKWAMENQDLLDFANFEENILGEEPTWVKEKRKRDFKVNITYKKFPWTKIEDEKLKVLLKKQRYNYSELSKMLNRTCGAIQRRCFDLGLKDRPNRESPHNKWTENDIYNLNKMIDDGYRYELMTDCISKSVKAIRGKVYLLYGTENLDKVRILRKQVS